jgi:hypothetical protein
MWQFHEGRWVEHDRDGVPIPSQCALSRGACSLGGAPCPGSHYAWLPTMRLRPGANLCPWPTPPSLALDLTSYWQCAG